MKNIQKYILVFCFILLPCISMATSPVEINSSHVAVNLGKRIEILEDKNNAFTIHEVLADKISNKFYGSNKNYHCFGYTKSAYWIRFSLNNKTKNKSKLFIRISNPTLNVLDLYAVNNFKKIVFHKRADSINSIEKRDIKHSDFIFKLVLSPGGIETYYIRIKSDNLLNFYVSLWSHDELFYFINNEQLVYGLTFGAIIILLLYNIFLLLYIQSKSYAYFVLYFLFGILHYLSLSNFAYQYIWHGHNWMVDNAHILLITISNVFLILFSKEFLETKVYDPLFNKILNISLLILSLSMFFPLFVKTLLAVVLSVIIFYLISMVLTITSIRVYNNDHRPARFYIYAMIAFWIGSIISYLQLFSFLPELVIWLVLLLIIAKYILFSLGLTDRINHMKKELETLNANLENIVENRTVELNSAIEVLEKSDAVMQTELELAGDIQKGILPEVPFYYEGIKIDAYYQAMKKVGGDFFDIFKMQGGYLGILVADASGHGMPAAFITALAKISFSEVMQQHLFPSEIFTQVNNNLVEIIKTDDFLTAFLVVISPNFEVFYCNASHQKTLVLRNETLQLVEWDTNGLFLGALAEAADMYEDNQDQLHYGDRMLLYSDGIVEAKNVNNESFGEERLKKIFTETSHVPLDAVKEKIVNELQKFSKGREQFDDISFVLVEIDPQYKEVFKYRDRGFKLLGEGNYEEAIMELLKSLQINPHDEKSHLYIGECYLKNGNDVKAVEHLKHYLHNNDVDANVWLHLAEAYFYLGEYTMSYNSSLKSIQIKHNFIDAMVICGFSLKNLNRNEEALDMWKKIMQIDVENEIAKKELYYAKID